MPEHDLRAPTDATMDWLVSLPSGTLVNVLMGAGRISHRPEDMSMLAQLFERIRCARPEALRITEPLLARLRASRDEAKRLCVRAYDGYPVDRMDLNDLTFRLEELAKDCAPSPLARITQEKP